jgi:NAD(P)-dependent dehydrogenase (short-subunit alcohol dehydrogenase family)
VGAGKTIVITGATDGLGKGLAADLAPTGARLLLHGRSAEKGEALLEELRPRATGELEFRRADLSSLEEVRGLSDELLEEDRIDVLVNNAGIGTAGPLTRELLPLLQRSAPSRIVNVSSAGQSPINFDDVMLERDYSSFAAYAQSKLALVMLTFDLAEELEGSGVSANCLHPGTYLPTKMVRAAGVDPVTPLEDGVSATRRLVDSDEVEGINGHYFDGTRESAPHPQAEDPEARRRLRGLSMELAGIQATA